MALVGSLLMLVVTGFLLSIGWKFAGRFVKGS